MIEVITLKLSGLLSLIKRLLNWLKELFRKEEEEEEEQEPEPEPTYTKEQFIEAIRELSKDPAWRARILKDSLLLLRKKYEGVTTKWIDKDRLTFQTIHRDLSCGITFSFGKGIYAIPKDTFLSIIKDLQQDAIKYTAEHTDCDNFATFMKGFADYVLGKEATIYATGLVLNTQEQYGRKVCICKSEYLVGGHGWNRYAILEPIEYERTGSTEKVVDEFTIVNYEPQSDAYTIDPFFNGRCYKTGGGLPIIYALS